VVLGVAGGVEQTLAQIDRSAIGNGRRSGAVDRVDAAGRLRPLSACRACSASCRLENGDERHLQTASWAFPLYLHADEPVRSCHCRGRAHICFCPKGRNPDFVRPEGRPEGQGKNSLAMFSFLGGFSSGSHIDGELSRHWRCRTMVRQPYRLCQSGLTYGTKKRSSSRGRAMW